MPFSSGTLGLFGAAAAFLIWGLLPIYWKALQGVPALELICHRVVWCMVFTALILTLQRRWGDIRTLLHQPRSILLLLLSACLITVNWVIYVWAVNANHMLEASLGYYINPLLNVLMGWLIFRDRLNPLQRLAIGLALAGVCVSLVSYGRPPWIALSLAVSFALYGLVRKVVQSGPLAGLFFETLLMTLPAGLWLARLEWQGTGALGLLDARGVALLLGTGAVTALPLLCFAHAVRRLRLVTVGIMQYIAPTCTFLLGVLVYKEPFDTARLVTFCFIWGGVLLYILDGVRMAQQERGVVPTKT